MSDNTKTREDLDEALDKYLLKRLKKGDAEPQIFEIARKRLKDLGLSKEVGDGNSAASRLAEELERNPEALEAHGVPPFMVPVSEERNAATA